MVFQSFALMPHMTVLDNTAFRTGAGRGGQSPTRKQAAEAARWSKWGSPAGGPATPMSCPGGMQQRVGLAQRPGRPILPSC